MNVQKEVEDKFGKVIGSVITKQHDTLFAVERLPANPQSTRNFMTVRHYAGKLYFHTYQLTRAEATYSLLLCAQREFGPVKVNACEHIEPVTMGELIRCAEADPTPIEPLKPPGGIEAQTVSFDGGLYRSSSHVNNALLLNFVSCREAGLILCAIGFEAGQAAQLVQSFGLIGRAESEEATGEAAEITILDKLKGQKT